MRNLFSGGLKDNPHLSYGFLTGILRVAKESIFSGLNNLKINSILDERYSEYFGFTSSEVHEMADYYHASDKYQELCEWYDGYLFGNTEIFNPWSVIGYFNNNCRPKHSGSLREAMTSSRVLASATPDIMERLELLMKGESFVTHIDTGVIYPQIQNDPSSVYSFLLVAGYLKAVSCGSLTARIICAKWLCPTKRFLSSTARRSSLSLRILFLVPLLLLFRNYLQGR